MRVLNVHSRVFPAMADAAVGALLARLAQPDDPLWPREAWPAMRFDRPLGVGATGGHGPVRYDVVRFEPGERIEFRFNAPRGFDGTHRFEVHRDGETCTLRHILEMQARGPAMLTWPLAFRPLHDALVEDCMAKAQAAVGHAPDVVRWSPWVRTLRWLISGGRPRAQVDYTA